jgi:hypothetical protein
MCLSQKKIDLLFTFLLVLFVAWVVWEARDWPFRARLFPWAIGIPVLVMAVIQLGLAVRAALRAQAVAVQPAGAPAAAAAEPAPGPGTASGESSAVAAALAAAAAEERRETVEAVMDPLVMRQRALMIAAWLFAFFFGIWFLGFKVGSTLLTIAFLRFGAHEKWKLSIIFGVVTYLFFLLMFDLALNVPFGPGLIAESLGLNSFDSYIVDPILSPITRGLLGR